MMNKKGSAIIWIVLIFAILLILALAVLILVNQDTKNKKNEEINYNMNVYLLIRDSEYKTQLNGEYNILNTSQYLKGDLVENAFSEIKGINNNHTKVLFKSDGFYSNLTEYYFNEQEKNKTSAKIETSLKKIGNIQIYHLNKIQEGDSEIELNIESQDYYQNLKICTQWTGGIINVITNSEEIEIPQRYKSSVDKCFNINKSLENEEIQIKFQIKSKDLEISDYVKFFFFDEDLYLVGNEINYLSEYNGENIGNKVDTTYTINYLPN